jgi:hypothetical protein
MTAKELWQAILDCKCGAWCDECCENFGALGDLLDRVCPVCGKQCPVTVTCPEHE